MGPGEGMGRRSSKTVMGGGGKRGEMGAKKEKPDFVTLVKNRKS